MNISNPDFKTIPTKFAPAIDLVKRYSHFFYFLLLATLVGYLLWHINSLNQAEPADDAVSSKLKTVQRPNIDQEALTQIQQLQDQNIEAKSLFEHARDNPFSE